MTHYDDIIYEEKDGVARITINRPKVYNAFRVQTLQELADALQEADQEYPTIGVVVLTGTGNKAFCAGGDVRELGEKGVYQRGMISIHGRVFDLLRRIQAPVIAAVNGYAVGGGHVLQQQCDLAIASTNAIFGQTGPRVGSFDAAHGAGFLARLVRERKAREIWYLCRQYDARQALKMGLVNKVVPPDKLEEEVNTWCKEILAMSPTAIASLKAAFNAQYAVCAGAALLADALTWSYWQSEEAFEARHSFLEHRKPDLSRFRSQG